MPSPFPGMNPYLEQDDAWRDFHEKFLPAVAERLVPLVRPNYIDKLDEHVYVHERLPDRPRLADVSVGLAPSKERDVERLNFLEVRDRRDRELVTVVKLLSPSNKRGGPDRGQYLAKRRALLASAAHLVEIDLLRGGRPMPLNDRPDCDYSLVVSRAERRPLAGIWPIGLRDRLPVVPVPLRPADGDAPLDLQDVLHQIYDASGYEDYVYEGAPEPALRPADAEWARAILAGAV